MGPLGTALLGAIVGATGWWLHPARAAWGAAVWLQATLCIVAGALAATLIKLAGNASNLFSDGQSAEWLATVLAACAAAALVGSIRWRQRAAPSVTAEHINE